MKPRPFRKGDITVLRHVRSVAQIRAAEEIADRTPCADFDRFEPLFEQVERELKFGGRKTLRFRRDASIAVSDFRVAPIGCTYGI